MTYVISDIHGCYPEFMTLLERAKFNPKKDVLYVLGDVVDRGDSPMECLKYVMNTKNVHLLIGNHEQMMMDYYDGKDRFVWQINGCEDTEKQFRVLPESEKEKILSYLHKRPLYKTISVNGQRYFLSHAGLDVSKPFCRQERDVLIWNREEFYGAKALKNYICLFGHTQTFYITPKICSVWFDPKHHDKIGIDCGCAYGGALALLRLEDMEIFYIKSQRGRYYRYRLAK
jgi:serine/threonine protein phosphatase 1